MSHRPSIHVGRNPWVLGILAGSLAMAPACREPQDTPRREEPDGSVPPNLPPLRVLLFEAETEWFHTSNPIADRVLRERAGRWGWDVVATKDPSVFTVETLASFDAVVFLLTSGTVLNATQRDAFHAYMAAGGGWAGVHSASHTDYDSPWQIGLVGSTFSGHPAIQPGVVVRTAGNDAIVDHVPPRWERTDEWYSFVWPPEKTANLEVLLALDEGAMPAYPGPGAADSLKMGFHPITWKLEYGGGRSFYTAMGHTDESYSDESFLELLHRGFEWAGGRRLSTRKGALVSATPRVR